MNPLDSDAIVSEILSALERLGMGIHPTVKKSSCRAFAKRGHEMFAQMLKDG